MAIARKRKFSSEETQDPRRKTFSSYFTTNLPPADRLKTEPITPYIDRQFIAAIEDKIPRKINSFISRKVSPSVRLKSEQAASVDEGQIRIFNMTYNSLRKKSLSKLQNDETHRSMMQQKWKKPVRRAVTFFNVESSLKYIQKKYEASFRNIKIGKYKQKMHPFCQIYETQADQVTVQWKTELFNNPFGEIPHIDY